MKTSNHTKYMSKNPLKQMCIKKFQHKLLEIILPLKPKKVLDVGCGEGFTLRALQEKWNCEVCGIDLNQESLNVAKSNVKNGTFITANAYQLPFSDNEYDVVICTEVLEHLENPQQALKELLRVSETFLVLSVPHEPYFRIGNLLALSHIKELGNAPGHINHWNVKSFNRLVQPFINEVNLKLSFPWIIAYGNIK